MARIVRKITGCVRQWTSQALRKCCVSALSNGPPLGFSAAAARESAKEWLRIGLMALAITLVIRWAFFEPYSIPSGSMEPTLRAGDRIFVNKLVYGLRVPFVNALFQRGADPQRGELVVFRTVEADSPHRILVKRVVALPGEEVRIANGGLYIDGARLTEPGEVADLTYTAPASPNATDKRYGVRPEPEFSRVPEDHYFLLGDNSRNSRDGRHFGWMPREHILGRVFAVWWPVPRWRDFTGFTGTWWWWTFWGLIAIVGAGRLFAARTFYIDGSTAGQTLMRGDHILVNTWRSGWALPFTRLKIRRGHAPRRGDLVVYHNPKPSNEEDELLVGRVAGYAGERIDLRGGGLRVNGEALDGYLPFARRSLTADVPEGPFEYPHNGGVSSGHYFILDDGSMAVQDSRTLGWTPHNHIVGVVEGVWWPLSRVRRIES